MSNLVTEAGDDTQSGHMTQIRRCLGQPLFFVILATFTAAPVAAQTPTLLLVGGDREETCRDVAFDSAGNFYAAGGTESSGFPTTNGSVVNPGAVGASSGPHDAWVRKYSPTGELLWSVVIGGPGYDRAYAIEVNATGVYIAGRAGTGFPTTPGAFQTTFNGDSTPEGFYGEQDGFVARLDHDGVVQWATYVGTPGLDIIRDFDVDATGATYLGLIATGSVSFVTAGSFDTTPATGTNVVPTKLSPDGARIIWSTYLGGSGDDGLNPSVRVDPGTGNVWIASFGSSSDYPTSAGAFDTTYNGALDIMLSALSPDGSDLVYSTYYGGSGDDAVETHALVISGDRVVVAAGTHSGNLPSTAGVLQTSRGGSGTDPDGFIAVFDTAGSHIASTYMGTSVADWIEGVAVLGDGRIFVAGGTQSSSFPMGASGTLAGGGIDGWLAVLTADLSRIVYAERIGGANEDSFRTAAATPAGRLGFGGLAMSPDFPTTDGSTYAGGGGGFDARDVALGWVDLPVTPCTDGETRACYDGPSGTSGVGACVSGSQTCTGAAWGSCDGDVLPASELCADGVDNDCDGTTDGSDTDCGAPPVDAGSLTDAGSPTDGGSLADAGGGTVGGTDAGMMPASAAGGCGCRAGGGRHGPHALGAGLVALACLARRRRKRSA